jgi:molybdopterin molybdotransferase
MTLPMPQDRPEVEHKRCEDVRLRGFSSRASVEEATAWVDAHAARLGDELVPAREAVGRVLAAALEAAVDVPEGPRAADDGYAVRSHETVGAGAYNPLRFELQPADERLGQATAALVAAGAALPLGADAVLPFTAAELVDGHLEVMGAVAQGMGIERKGQEVRAGTALLAASRVLRPQDAGLLVSLRADRLCVVSRPRVRVVVAGSKGPSARPPGDADGAMLEALVTRDGGVVESVREAGGREALAAAMAAPGADAVLVAGRTGSGPDDDAPLALAEAGELDLHGVALRPGGSAGFGRAGTVPVVLLPGAPPACLCAYELFAGRLIRRLGGRAPGLPHAVREAEVGAKIVSTVGCVDMCWVQLVRGRAEPLGWAEEASLGSIARSDGFVLIPAPLEGHGPGALVAVYLYG